MMSNRSMRVTDNKGKSTYFSTFNPKTGNLVRMVDLRPWHENPVRSPSPELVDISITNRCGLGCEYCYQDSLPKSDHGPKDLVETTLKGFTTMPYQIAIGGGEPTGHPDFIEILHRARELGTVPNYTTAGHRMTPAILEATEKVCGGVAMTFHAWKGEEWFASRYKRIRDALSIQVNVHLIADRHIGETLPLLTRLQEKVGPIRVVLLAYYPDVGRASPMGLVSRQVYSTKFPDAIRRAVDSGMHIAFSEGLLPYFLSRPDLPVDTSFAMRAEGYFSCYVDVDGTMSDSSFSRSRGVYIRDWKVFPHQKEEESDEDYEARLVTLPPSNVWAYPSQTLWESLRSYGGVGGAACSRCEHQHRCTTPHEFHYYMCRFAAHNRLPL